MQVAGILVTCISFFLRRIKMKQSNLKYVVIFLVAMVAGALLVSTAHANPLLSRGDIQLQGQAQQQQQQNSQQVNTNVDASSNIPKTAASAIAPAVYSGVDCVISQQESKAFSVFFLSFSGTTGVSFNELCYAFKRGQFDVADKLACMKSSDYALANPACKDLLSATRANYIEDKSMEAYIQLDAYGEKPTTK